MYRLLIVDDEPIIANALFEVFQNFRQLDLDVYKAYSGNAALEWLYRTKIDIVLTDIRMPGIDGLALLEQICANWPQCRVILLTGYDEFDYIYKAIQYKGVSYLLKTEGFTKVIKAVEDAVADIDKSLKIEDIINKANQQISIASSLLQKEFFMNILKGEVASSDINKEQLTQLGIQLSPNKSFLILIGRIDNFPVKISYSEKSRVMYSIKLIAEQYFSPLTVNVNIIDENANLIWLIQPIEELKEDSSNHQRISVWESTLVYVKGMLEMIQASCNKTLGISISFAISNNPVSWELAAEKYAFLRQLLDYRIGSGTEMLLSDKNLSLDETSFNTMSSIQQIQTRLNKLGTMQTYLERGLKDDFFKLLAELTEGLTEVNSLHFNPALEIYYSISLQFLSYINRWNLTEKIAFKTGINRLTRIDEHGSWKSAVQYFVKLADIIFTIQNSEQEKRAKDVIAHIQKYIDGNLSEELSLVKLADIAYFNPSYLSRLFKQVTGKNISDYIFEAKIRRAKQLLEKADIKIYEIAEAIGYNSAQNFTRFFKKITNITPQEYREFFLTGKQVR